MAALGNSFHKRVFRVEYARSVGSRHNGLLQLLQTHRSLSRMSLAIDTRNYTELPSSGSLTSATLPQVSYINVLDSNIEAESVPAVGAFFSGFVPCVSGGIAERPKWKVYKNRWPRCPDAQLPSHFTLYAWSGDRMASRPGSEAYRERWEAVQRLVKVTIIRHLDEA